jgi:hypothetical protein
VSVVFFLRLRRVLGRVLLPQVSDHRFEAFGDRYPEDGQVF